MLEFLNSPIDGVDYFQESKDLNLNRKIESYDFEDVERKTSECSYFWAYVAGIMDTDGSFSIERHIRKPGENRQKNDLVKFRPKLILTMLSKPCCRPDSSWKKPTNTPSKSIPKS
jgi:hypothetical protein